MYKELRQWLEDKKILEEILHGLEERIEFKIQKELGMHATTFKELKIQCVNIDDKFTNTFIKIEKLDKRREVVQEELDIIDRRLDKIDNMISKMNGIEKQTFKCRYIWGLSIKQTAERLGFSIQRIKQINKEFDIKSKD